MFSCQSRPDVYVYVNLCRLPNSFEAKPKLKLSLNAEIVSLEKFRFQHFHLNDDQVTLKEYIRTSCCWAKWETT